MNRRGFLASLMAAAVIDPERLLYVPGKKLISIPKPRLKKIIRVPVINQMAGHYSPMSYDGMDLGRGSFMHVSYELREVDADYEVDENQVVLRQFWKRDQLSVEYGAQKGRSYTVASC